MIELLLVASNNTSHSTNKMYSYNYMCLCFYSKQDIISDRYYYVATLKFLNDAAKLDMDIIYASPCHEWPRHEWYESKNGWKLSQICLSLGLLSDWVGAFSIDKFLQKMSGNPTPNDQWWKFRMLQSDCQNLFFLPIGIRSANFAILLPQQPYLNLILKKVFWIHSLRISHAPIYAECYRNGSKRVLCWIRRSRAPRVNMR